MTQNDTYQTITAASEGLFKEKGSKFIGLAFPVATESDFADMYRSICKNYHDARHRPYAYRVGFRGEHARASDDGEPSNSAGKPILAQIDARQLSNVGVVVVRYFGGTLLGVGGLINAFRSAASDALDHATIVTRTIDDVLYIQFDYIAMNDVMSVLKAEKIEPMSQKFDLTCSLTVQVRQSTSIRIVEKLNKVETVKISK